MSFMEERLKRFFGEVGHVHAGRLEIEVDGDVKAKFFKAGRLFDVELTYIRQGTN